MIIKMNIGKRNVIRESMLNSSFVYNSVFFNRNCQMPCSATLARDLLTRIYDKAFIPQALVLPTKNYTLNNISIFLGDIFCKSMKFFDFEKRLKKSRQNNITTNAGGGGGGGGVLLLSCIFYIAKLSIYCSGQVGHLC